jgi:DNA-binding transcriptional LysR family regulator
LRSADRIVHERRTAAAPVSVSRQILLLEEELKEQLFPRIRRKIAARRAGAQARAICCELAP